MTEKHRPIDVKLAQLMESRLEVRDLLAEIAVDQNKVQEFRGECFGVRIVKESYEFDGLQKEHQVCYVLVEDDENWFLADFSFDSFWLDDVIQQLTLARDFLKKKQEQDTKTNEP